MASELEQFCVIARSQKDRACANIIQQVLKDKKIHVFGELLAVPSVQALKGTEFNNAYETLELFAYGSFDDYTATPARFLELTPFMAQKLRRLTLFSMAAKSNKLAYDDLLAALQLQTVRDLEDFVIDAVYSELIVGKLDQMGQVFTVSWVTARDVRREDLGAVLDKLTRWRERCTTTKTILQKSSRDVFQKGAVYAVENSEVQRKADIEREKLKALVEAGEMDCDDDFIGGRRERSKPGSSRSSALDRLGLGIGGGIGGGRSSASHTASTRSKF